MMSEILLELVPVREKSANYDDVLPDGRVLVRSRQPLFDGARRLLAEGVAPDTALTTRRRGSPIIAMRSTVGEAAKWTVAERNRGGLHKERWQPYDAGSSFAVVPEIERAEVTGQDASPEPARPSLQDRAA